MWKNIDCILHLKAGTLKLPTNNLHSISPDGDIYVLFCILAVHTITNNAYVESAQKVSEPLAASEVEGRRTVTQREDASAQDGSSPHITVAWDLI